MRTITLKPKRIAKKTSTKKPTQDSWWDTQGFGCVPSLVNIIVSVHLVFNEMIPHPNKYFAELERPKINVASESQDPAD